MTDWVTVFLFDAEISNRGLTIGKLTDAISRERALEEVKAELPPAAGLCFQRRQGYRPPAARVWI